MNRQTSLLDEPSATTKSLHSQLLKWIGNKQRFAKEIVSYFPHKFAAYYEPFLGSGAVLGTLAPSRGYAADTFPPLMEIWFALKQNPELLKKWYADRWHAANNLGKVEAYEQIKAAFNVHPNGADLVFLCRACYGGVVRFRQADGYMSTPCGVHTPINPKSFANRVDEWRHRVANTEFCIMDFEETLNKAIPGSVVYCDPPYRWSQRILYRSQTFKVERLFDAVAHCKKRGVYVVVSIDGHKKSGNQNCSIALPQGLFEREIFINCGRSMLRRFQMGGQTLEKEVVADRLLLTY